MLCDVYDIDPMKNHPQVWESITQWGALQGSSRRRFTDLTLKKFSSLLRIRVA